MCKHTYNWNKQKTIDNKHYGICSHCDEIVRIEHKGWSYSGDTVGYQGVTISSKEKQTYLNRLTMTKPIGYCDHCGATI